MKKQYKTLSLLALSCAMGLFSCGSSPAASSSSVEPESYINVTQPEVAYIGDTLNLSDYVDANVAYRVESSDERVAVVENGQIKIVGNGDAIVTLIGNTVANRLKIKAFSQSTKKTKALVDALGMNYTFNGKTIEYNGTTESSGYEEDNVQTHYILKNPYYCYDGYWTWDGNSLYKLAKLKDAEGTYRSYQYVLEDAQSRDMDSLSFTRRNYEASYADQCFYMAGDTLLPLNKFEEQDDSLVCTDWNTIEQIYEAFAGGYTYVSTWRLPNIYQYQSCVLTDTSTDTSSSLHVKISAICDYEDDDVNLMTMEGDFTAIGESVLPLLESYVQSGQTPSSCKISVVEKALAPYQEQGNYKIDYRAGTMMSYTNHDWFKGDYWHTGIYDDDTGRYDYSMEDIAGYTYRTKESFWSVDHDETEAQTASTLGLTTDADGIYLMSKDETSGKYKKGNLVSASINSMDKYSYYNMLRFEDETLREADPVLQEDGSYLIEGKLDDGDFSACVDYLAGFGNIAIYQNYSNWYGNYTQATMTIKDDEIIFFAGVQFSAYIYGVEVRIYDLGKVSFDFE